MLLVAWDVLNVGFAGLMKSGWQSLIQSLPLLASG